MADNNNKNSNAHVVKDNAPAVAKSVAKEQLTDDVQKRLFGVNYNHVCIYNNETQTLMTSKYNGVNVSWDEVYVSWADDDTTNSKKLKGLFEKAFPKFELVAQVTMQVSYADFPDLAKWSKEPVMFNIYGEYTVGNLVIRNKETGRLELLKAGAWFGLSWHRKPYDAAQRGACVLPFYCANRYRHPDFRAALLNGRGQR